MPPLPLVRWKGHRAGGENPHKTMPNYNFPSSRLAVEGHNMNRYAPISTEHSTRSHTAWYIIGVATILLLAFLAGVRLVEGYYQALAIY